MNADSVQPSLRDVRDAYLQRHGFSTAAYTDRWVRVKLGPITFVLPSTKTRRKAIRYHDLHHALTGYHATPIGEAEIGAWEVATGCKRLWAAWVLNLAAMGLGLAIAPRRTWLAFLRGRRSGDNLYGQEFGDELLDRPLPEVKAEIALAETDVTAAPGDRLWFIAASAAALSLYILPLLVLAGGTLLAWLYFTQ